MEIDSKWTAEAVNGPDAPSVVLVRCQNGKDSIAFCVAVSPEGARKIAQAIWSAAAEAERTVVTASAVPNMAHA